MLRPLLLISSVWKIKIHLRMITLEMGHVNVQSTLTVGRCYSIRLLIIPIKITNCYYTWRIYTWNWLFLIPILFGKQRFSYFSKENILHCSFLELYETNFHEDVQSGLENDKIQKKNKTKLKLQWVIMDAEIQAKV